MFLTSAQTVSCFADQIGELNNSAIFNAHKTIRLVISFHGFLENFTQDNIDIEIVWNLILLPPTPIKCVHTSFFYKHLYFIGRASNLKKKNLKYGKDITVKLIIIVPQ